MFLKRKQIEISLNYRLKKNVVLGVTDVLLFDMQNVLNLINTPTNHRNQYRMSRRGVSGLALEKSKMHTFSRI